jgi:hypothetical protein
VGATIVSSVKPPPDTAGGGKSEKRQRSISPIGFLHHSRFFCSRRRFSLIWRRHVGPLLQHAAAPQPRVRPRSVAPSLLPDAAPPRRALLHQQFLWQRKPRTAGIRQSKRKLDAYFSPRHASLFRHASLKGIGLLQASGSSRSSSLQIYFPSRHTSLPCVFFPQACSFWESSL